MSKPDRLSSAIRSCLSCRNAWASRPLDCADGRGIVARHANANRQTERRCARDRRTAFDHASDVAMRAPRFIWTISTKHPWRCGAAPQSRPEPVAMLKAARTGSKRRGHGMGWRRECVLRLAMRCDIAHLRALDAMTVDGRRSRMGGLARLCPLARHCAPIPSRTILIGNDDLSCGGSRCCKGVPFWVNFVAKRKQKIS
jgi:hypothetical protein